MIGHTKNWPSHGKDEWIRNWNILRGFLSTEWIVENYRRTKWHDITLYNSTWKMHMNILLSELMFSQLRALSTNSSRQFCRFNRTEWRGSKSRIIHTLHPMTSNKATHRSALITKLISAICRSHALSLSWMCSHPQWRDLMLCKLSSSRTHGSAPHTQSGS